MKFIMFILFSLVSFSVFANPTSETTIKTKNNNSLKEKFDLEFLLTSEQTKNIVTKKMDGEYTKFDTSVLYKHDQNNEFRAFLATRYINTKMEDMGNRFQMFFGEVMYRRKNILTQSKHGVLLNAELKNYRIIDDEIKNDYGYDGATIPQLIFKKSWGRKLSAKLRVRRHLFHSNADYNYTLDHEDRVYLDLTTMFARKWMFNTQLKYQHKVRKGDGLDYRFMELAEYKFNPMTRSGYLDTSKVPTAKKNQEIVTLHSGFLHLFNRKTMLEVYGETKLSNTYDKRDVATIAEDEFVFGTALYLTAF